MGWMHFGVFSKHFLEGQHCHGAAKVVLTFVIKLHLNFQQHFTHSAISV